MRIRTNSKKAALRIASLAKAPIVPVAISGTADMMENHHKFAFILLPFMLPLENRFI